jgi:hypothetical protein
MPEPTGSTCDLPGVDVITSATPYNTLVPGAL